MTAKEIKLAILNSEVEHDDMVTILKLLAN
jgi:hypothetical protein